MTVDEIKNKYQCDKRQTGQVAVTNPQMRQSSSIKSASSDLKRGIRAFSSVAQGRDPLAFGDAKWLREKKARAIKEISKLLNDVKNAKNIGDVAEVLGFFSKKIQELIR